MCEKRTGDHEFGLGIRFRSSESPGVRGTKTYFDITGNGVNHPGDFGHRVYAEVISALLLS